MFVGIDHVALTAEDFTRQAAFLQEAGYERRFHQSHIPNPPNKRELMERWSKTHSLALFEAERSTPIEIIDYGYIVDAPPRYVPTIEDTPEELNQLGNLNLTLSSMEEHRKGNAQDFAFDTLAVATEDVEASHAFWSDLGFTHGNGQNLVFKSPIGTSTLTLSLHKDSSASEVTPLDGRGLTCLALVSSSPQRDLDRLLDAGYDTTRLHRIDFPDRSVKVGFVIGPSGEPVELVTPVDRGE